MVCIDNDTLVSNQECPGFQLGVSYIIGKTTQIPSVSVFCNPQTVDLACTFQEQLVVVKDFFI